MKTKKRMEAYDFNTIYFAVFNNLKEIFNEEPSRKHARKIARVCQKQINQMLKMTNPKFSETKEGKKIIDASLGAHKNNKLMRIGCETLLDEGFKAGRTNRKKLK